MNAFLWTIVVIGVLELVVTLQHAMQGEVPERTPSGMAWNGALMFALAMWAFWLLVRA